MKSKLVQCAAFGIPFGAALYIVYAMMGINIGLPMAVFAAVNAGLLFLLVLTGLQRLLDKRYSEIEAQIPYPVFYKTNGNFDLGGTVKNGNLYFCDAGIVCVSMEEQPYAIDEILVQDIFKISFDTIRLHIHTKDGRLFKITTPDAAHVVELLKEKDWLE